MPSLADLIKEENKKQEILEKKDEEAQEIANLPITKEKTIMDPKIISPKDLDSYPMSKLRAFYNFCYGRDPPHTSDWNKDKVRNAIIDFFKNL